jgi:hypothetical protein
LGKKTRADERGAALARKAEAALGFGADTSSWSDSKTPPAEELKLTLEMLTAVKAEAARLGKINADWTSVRLALRDGFISEREELLSRVLRIEMRLRALGFPPTVVGTATAPAPIPFKPA